MMRSRATVLALAGTAALAGCEINPAGGNAALVVGQSALVDSAPVGATAVTWHTVNVTIDGADGPVSFLVTSRNGSPWLRLGTGNGTAPGTYELGYSAQSLPIGEHVDTVVFAPLSAGVAPALVPVRLNVQQLPTATWTATPASIRDSVLVGSLARWSRGVSVSVTGISGPIAYDIRAAFASNWIIFPGAQSGTAPGGFSFDIHPAGRAVGVYVDTLSILAGGLDPAVVKVPVRLEILPCQVTAIGTPPLTFASELSNADCVSPRFSDRWAERLRIQGTAGDTITIETTGQSYNTSILIEAEGAPSPLAASNTCPLPPGYGCLRYVTLPVTGPYIIEVTTWTPYTGGNYSVAITKPRVPDAAFELQQLSSSALEWGAGGPIPVGDTTYMRSVRLEARLSDPDRDSLTLQVELRPVGTPYTGTPTHTEPPGAGNRRSFYTENLTVGVGYKWRARAADPTGRVGPWVEFGGNATDAIDFRIVPHPP